MPIQDRDIHKPSLVLYIVNNAAKDPPDLYHICT